MDQATRETLIRVRALEKELPLNLWLAMATDAVSALVPPSSGLVRELESLRSENSDAGSDTANRGERKTAESNVRRHVNSILDSIELLVDLYKPPPNRTVLLEDIRQGLSSQLENVKHTLQREVEFAISDQLFKHFVFRVLGGLLIALVAGFLGIDIWFSQKVIAAQQQVAKMQEQVNGAQLTIYAKASELNKTLDDARETLLKSRDAATDILKTDRSNAQKEIDWVKGTVTDQVKKEGVNGTDLVKKEEGVQIDRLRKVAVQEVLHLNEPWPVWLLVTAWLPSLVAFGLSVIALWVVRKHRIGHR